MEELLTLDDIEEVGGEVSRLSVEVEDVLAVAETVNPDAGRGVLAWYAMKVKRSRGNVVLIFTVVELSSPTEARQRLAQVESGLGYERMDSLVGDASAMLAASSGTGIAFVKAHRVVSLQSTVGDGMEPILDDGAMERLARMIEERL